MLAEIRVYADVPTALRMWPNPPAWRARRLRPPLPDVARPCRCGIGSELRSSVSLLYQKGRDSPAACSPPLAEFFGVAAYGHDAPEPRVPLPVRVWGRPACAGPGSTRPPPQELPRGSPSRRLPRIIGFPMSSSFRLVYCWCGALRRP